MSDQPTDRETLFDNAMRHMEDPADARILGHYLVAVARAEQLAEALQHLHRVRQIMDAIRAGATTEEATAAAFGRPPKQRAE